MRLTRKIRGWNCITLSYPMFSVRRDWILGQIIYPTKPSYSTKRRINEFHLRDIIVLSCPDGIQ